MKPIGPSPCLNCGGEYGEHTSTCHRRATEQSVSEVYAFKVTYKVTGCANGSDMVVAKTSTEAILKWADAYEKRNGHADAHDDFLGVTKEHPDPVIV